MIKQLPFSNIIDALISYFQLTESFPTFFICTVDSWTMGNSNSQNSKTTIRMEWTCKEDLVSSTPLRFRTVPPSSPNLSAIHPTRDAIMDDLTERMANLNLDQLDLDG